MTNGEKLCIDFPNMRYTISKHRVITTIGVAASFDLDWWNAEYKEPTTKKDCNTCTHNNETDGSNCYECVKDMCNNYKPTTKNDLAVDYVDRREVIKQIFYSTDNSGDVVLGSALRERIEKLPSVTPQLSSGLDKNSKKLEKDFGESDCISRQSVAEYIDYIQNHGMGKKKSFDFIKKFVANLPPATSQESKTGHWTEEFNDLEGEVRFTCSSCGKYQLFGTDFCYHCGSDNREVE